VTENDPLALPAAPIRAPRERTVLPVIGVVVVIVAVLFGGYAVAGSLAAEGPVDVAGVVRVFPLPGWELAARFDQPPGVRLARGSVNLVVATVSFTGSSQDLLRDYVTDALESEAEQLSVSPVEVVTIRSGLSASRVTYVGSFGDVQVPIEGTLTTVVSASGVGAVFDGWAPSGLLRSALGDIETIVDRAEVA
jgi:hypothetical protein